MPVFMTKDHATVAAPRAAAAARETTDLSVGKPQAQRAGEAGSCASTCSGASALPFPEQELVVANTFITLPLEGAGAARRASSCPPRIRTPCTVMLRNLPNRAKPAKVEEHATALGFREFQAHLPIDARTGVNKGYAFVRFPDEAAALRFCAAVHGTRLPGTLSTKRLVAVKAANQGGPLKPRAAHFAHARGPA